MTQIETLAPKAFQKLTGLYTLKENDMGRKDLANTITASAGALQKQQVIDAPDVEDVNYDFEPSMTISNAPEDGSNTFAIGDTVKFDTTIKNTGNQTLKKVEAAEQTEGVNIVDDDAYEFTDGKAVFDSIAPKESAVAKSEYTAQEGDDEKEGWMNTVQVTAPPQVGD